MKLKKIYKKGVLDAEELVVFRNTLRTSGSTSLNLTNTKSDDNVGDDGVLGLATTVRDHDRPAVGLRELGTKLIKSC